jgi:spore germination cell wall hydrolase CwlJ-like protein
MKISSVRLLLAYSVVAVFCLFTPTETHTAVQRATITIDNDAPIKDHITVPLIVQLDPKEVTCLTENIYREAGNQPEKGRRAVGAVTLNRVKVGYRGAKTICDVVHQQKQGICQFSWVCDPLKHGIKTKNAVEQKAWDECLTLAKKMIIEYNTGSSKDVTRGATHFHADSVEPLWADDPQYIQTAQIAGHIFYRMKGSPVKYGTK